MSRSIPQQPGAPIVGSSIIRRGAYGANVPESGRKYGTTAEDLRNFPQKDAGEEDYRSFVISDQMNTDYFRTRFDTYYFEYRQEESPTVLSMRVPKNPFPIRMNSAFFFFDFEGTVTIPKKSAEEDPDNLLTDIKPLNYKWLRMIKEASIKYGANSQEVCLHLTPYNTLNRIMYYMTQPCSKSNLRNNFIFADMIPDFHVDGIPLTGTKNSLSETAAFYNWTLLDVKDPDNEKNSSITDDKLVKFKYQVCLPLTLLHPMFNYETVLPPESDLFFKFDFFKMEDCVKKIFKTEKDWAITMKLNMRNCALNVEMPEQNPQVLLSLKMKQYRYSPILLPVSFNCQVYKPAGSLISQIRIVPENGMMPVKIDFSLAENDDVNNDRFVGKIFKYLKKIRYNINQPFPQHREFEYFVNYTTDAKLPDQDCPRRRIEFSMPEFAQHHNLQFSKFGEQFVSKGFKPPIKGSNTSVNLLDLIQFEKPNQTAFLENTSITNDQYFQQTILQPSNQFNAFPYPIVRGSLNLILTFQETHKDTELNLNCLFNLYYNYELHVESDKVSFLPLEDLGVNLDTPKTQSMEPLSKKVKYQ